MRGCNNSFVNCTKMLSPEAFSVQNASNVVWPPGFVWTHWRIVTASPAVTGRRGRKRGGKDAEEGEKEGREGMRSCAPTEVVKSWRLCRHLLCFQELSLQDMKSANYWNRAGLMKLTSSSSVAVSDRFLPSGLRHRVTVTFRSATATRRLLVLSTFGQPLPLWLTCLCDIILK